MKHNVKLTAWLTVLSLTMTMLFSCSKAPADVDASTDTAAVTTSAVVTEMQTENTEAVEVPTEAVTETVTEQVSAPAAESKTEPSVVYPTVISENGRDALTGIAPAAAGAYIDPLTGTAVSQAEAERRPVAIMLNNITVALPQQNIAAADVLYECQVEGGLTRLMGVFNDYADLVAIGSIRSSREYYIDFAANHDAIYVHAGGSEEAYRNLKSRLINNIDAVNDGVVTGFFYRDPNRLGKMGYEHTLVIDGGKINGAIAAKGYRTDYAAAFDSPLQFVGEGQKIELTNGSSTKQVTVKFGAHTTQFVYNASQNRYLRWQNGNKHIDGVTGEQLGFENVIILICPYTLTKDDYNHIEVATVGTGKGYYMTGGKIVEIRWTKTSGDAPIKLCYTSGKEITLTPGKTNFEVVSYDKNVTVTAG